MALQLTRCFVADSPSRSSNLTLLTMNRYPSRVCLWIRLVSSCYEKVTFKNNNNNNYTWQHTDNLSNSCCSSALRTLRWSEGAFFFLETSFATVSSKSAKRAFKRGMHSQHFSHPYVNCIISVQRRNNRAFSCRRSSCFAPIIISTNAPTVASANLSKQKAITSETPSAFCAFAALSRSFWLSPRSTTSVTSLSTIISLGGATLSSSSSLFFFLFFFF